MSRRIEKGEEEIGLNISPVPLSLPRGNVASLPQGGKKSYTNQEDPEVVAEIPRGWYHGVGYK